jgi:hypothetical protein
MLQVTPAWWHLVAQERTIHTATNLNDGALSDRSLTRGHFGVVSLNRFRAVSENGGMSGAAPHTCVERFDVG